MRVVVNVIVFVAGVLAGIWLAVQFFAHLFEGRFSSMEQRTEAIKHETEQVKLALGCMIQDQQQLAEAEEVSRNPIGFKMNQS